MIRGVVNRIADQRIAVYNGVAVRDTDLCDGHDHEPHYKATLTQVALDATERGDRVVVVGGGRGVVPTHLARQGRDVVVYEAAREMVLLLESTRYLNGVDYRIEHARVGKIHAAYGSPDGAAAVAPGELQGDVLVLDCEGAETSILPVDGFRTVVVETHPRFDANAEIIRGLLPGAETVGQDEQSGEVIVA